MNLNHHGNYNSNYISNRLNLRDPQREALNTLAELSDIILSNSFDESLNKLKALYSSAFDFEREFASLCFALATGVGKTRLMGAFIAYLHYEKKINNFLVLSPNLTIYNKLKEDFGNPSSSKYVFKGIEKFSVTKPRIIDGENYEYQNISDSFDGVTINLFNIAKINADSKGKNGVVPRIKRLNEVLGQSYFDYLVSLKDLVLLMDESHHYRADQGMKVINELKPILGLEVTATPQIQKASKRILFKNIVYSYALSDALRDKQFVKIPAVATKANFDASQYTKEEIEHIKLEDGIKIHEDTKFHLEKYAKEFNQKLVKPIVLVVAKDTEHSAEIKSYLESNLFYNGIYKNKILEIHSNQSASEKEENINLLLSLEQVDNPIEIVIHVNMLKEGWDVNNLYTIIPLRSSVSETLTEQTLGRGLRLPYGKRTGVYEIDLLTVVFHDKYQEVLNFANLPNSIFKDNPFVVREVSNEPQKELHQTNTTFKDQQEKIELNPEIPNATELGKMIQDVMNQEILKSNRQVKNIDEVKSSEHQQSIENKVIDTIVNQYPEIKQQNQHFEEIKEATRQAIQQTTEHFVKHVIPIPYAIAQPIESKIIFHPFKIDTSPFNNLFPIDDVTVRKELTQDAKTTFIHSDMFNHQLDEFNQIDNFIVMYLSHSNADIFYDENSDLLFDLVQQVKTHCLSYLNQQQVIQTFIDHKKYIADEIYRQMKLDHHVEIQQSQFEVIHMRAFSNLEVPILEKYKHDFIHDFRETIPANQVPAIIFNGFKKACHLEYKFKSNTEKIFAMILEDSHQVEKWLCPSQKQFKLFWDQARKHQYQPDFIVETQHTIYMIELKDSRYLDNDIVLAKANIATAYCNQATQFNQKHGGKEWRYKLISHEKISMQNQFDWLIKA